jgi:hypothetical protein
MSDSASEYRIEKGRRAVVLTTIGGAPVAGDVFVQPYARHRSGPEEPEDVLNSAEPFFPLVTASGETLLFAKEQVAEVECDGPPEDDDPQRLAGLRSALVEVHLTGGTVRTGFLYLETPTDRPRLLDYLNLVPHRFIALQGAEGVRLVNRRFIAHVRPLD